MNIKRFNEILREEVEAVINEASITKRFSKAVEAYRTIQVKQQELRKKFVSEKDPKKKESLKKALIDLHKKVQKAESDFNAALKMEPVDLDENKLYKKGDKLKVKRKGETLDIQIKKRSGGQSSNPLYTAHVLSGSIKGKQIPVYQKDLIEGKLNEDVFKSFQSDIPGSKIEMATNTDKRKSVQARKTDKVWDDGVPVLKYIARASKKPSPLPKGKFKIIDDSKYGWWYYQVGNTWYGIQQKDYGTPPFEY